MSDLRNKIAKLNLIFSISLFSISICLSSNAFSQSKSNTPNTSPNIPTSIEASQQTDFTEEASYPEILDAQLKDALENGNEEIAESLRKEIYRKVKKENLYHTTNVNPSVLKEVNAAQTDWFEIDKLVFGDTMRSVDKFYNQLDIKASKDGYLYAAVNVSPTEWSTGIIYIFESGNSGLTWNLSTSLVFDDDLYIGNLTMLIESRNDAVHDSTRVILFYTVSENTNMNDAKLYFMSMRRNGFSRKFGIIASPSAGNQISYVSAVSDGEFYSSATFFGVVFTESDNITKNTEDLKYFRTIDWGATWVGVTLGTIFNDCHISACYKEGSTADSIWIAVERKFTPTESHVRVFSTRFHPTSSYYTYYLTSEEDALYEKPSLTIKQNNVTDSAMITSTKDGAAVYHSTTNAGASWNLDNLLSAPGNNNNKLVNCSSSPSGSKPFTTVWMTANGDSINFRKGAIGSMESIKHKINNYASCNLVSPVCYNSYSNFQNLSHIVYSGPNLENAYSESEGYKSLNLKVIPQGMYIPNQNVLSIYDTVMVFLRKSSSPFNVVDSSKAIIQKFFYYGIANFLRTSDENYYIQVKHRNALETWSTAPVNFSGAENYYYKFDSVATSAYGNNLIQVDASPIKFGMFSGDINHDGTIDLTDIVGIYNDANNFVQGNSVTDLNGDTYTDLSDLVFTYNNSINFVNVQKP